MKTDETTVTRTASPKNSIFWPVASVLAAVLVTVGLLAVALSALYAYQASLQLVENGLRLRLDGMAEEVELRADSVESGFVQLTPRLRLDLASRFPDPVKLVDADGILVEVLVPSDSSSAKHIEQASSNAIVPANLGEVLETGGVVVDLSGDSDAGTWGAAPLYDSAGFLIGGLLVQPLDNSKRRELADVRSAFIRAMIAIGMFAILAAILIAGLLTWFITKPVRQLSGQIAQIGAGDYSARVQHRRNDELGQLADSINTMAGQVESSFDRLRSADTMRRELVANIGHDLRTPLSALSGYLEEAIRYLDEGKNESADKALETVGKQAAYLNSLVSDLFELSVLDSGKVPLALEPILVPELLNDAISSQARSFADVDLQLTLSLQENLPTLMGDGVRLLRVLANLLSNARDHTPSGGRVEVVATSNATTLQVDVKDTGTGLVGQDVDRIFDRYYRGSGARTRGSSTGLGLAISRAIVRAHGGELRASTRPEGGSVFCLEIPLGTASDS